MALSPQFYWKVGRQLPYILLRVSATTGEQRLLASRSLALWPTMLLVYRTGPPILAIVDVRCRDNGHTRAPVEYHAQ